MSRKIWLDFGKILSKNLKSSFSALQEASLTWDVELKKIKVVDGSTIPDKVAIVRKDNNVVLGIVNTKYKCIQNSQVFSFLDDIVQQGKASFYAAGHIGQGEKVWLLIKLHDEIKFDTDTIQKFIMFSNSHDGRGCIRAYFLPLRMQTQTLLNIYFGKRVEQGIQLRHVGNVNQRINESKKIIDLAETFYDSFQQKAEKLYTTNFKQKKVELFFSNCFETYSLDSTRTKNTFKRIYDLYSKEIKTFPKSKETAWAWFNAVADFIDYERLSKGKNSQEKISNHLESLFWGSGLLLKQKAWDTLSSLNKL